MTWSVIKQMSDITWVVCNKLTSVWALTKKLLVSWQFSGPYGVTKYGSGWRKDVVNQCLEFDIQTHSLHVCQWFLGGGRCTPTPSLQHSWTSPLLWKSSRSSSAGPTPVKCKQSEQFLSSRHQLVFWLLKGIVRKAEIFYWQASTAKWTLWLAVCINLFATQITSQFICSHLLTMFWQLKGLVGKAEIIYWKASTVKWTLCLAVFINLFAMKITNGQTS